MKGMDLLRRYQKEEGMARLNLPEAEYIAEKYL